MKMITRNGGTLFAVSVGLSMVWLLGVVSYYTMGGLIMCC